MELKSAKVEEEYYILDFQRGSEEESETNLNYRLRVKSPDKMMPSIKVETLLASELQDYVLNVVKTRLVFITDKVDRELFYRAADFIVRLEEMPMNIKTYPYPGTSLILMEYGVLGVSDEYVIEFQRLIVEALTTKRTEEVVVPVDEEEEKEEVQDSIIPVVDFDDEPFPLGSVSESFVEDDFQLGYVEKQEKGEEEDD